MYRRSTPGETEKERTLFCYQISQQIVEGRFPLNKILAFELAALMAQVKYETWKIFFDTREMLKYLMPSIGIPSCIPRETLSEHSNELS